VRNSCWFEASSSGEAPAIARLQALSRRQQTLGLVVLPSRHKALVPTVIFFSFSFLRLFAAVPSVCSPLTDSAESGLEITGHNKFHFFHHCFGVSSSDVLIQRVGGFHELHGHIGNLSEPVGW